MQIYINFFIIKTANEKIAFATKAKLLTVSLFYFAVVDEIAEYCR